MHWEISACELPMAPLRWNMEELLSSQFSTLGDLKSIQNRLFGIMPEEVNASSWIELKWAQSSIEDMVLESKRTQRTISKLVNMILERI